MDNGEDSASYFAIEVSATTKNSTSQAWYVRGINTDGASFTYDDTQIDGLGVTISIMVNHTANNVVVKPMIRLASDTDTSHGLYTMTNRELTEQKFTVYPTALSSVDLNTIMASGIYKLNGSITNGAGVNYGELEVVKQADTFITQIIYPVSTPEKIYKRVYQVGTWSSWYVFTGTVVS